MSRIESVAKGGYYPTPPRVAEAIARFLVPAPANGTRVVRLLDPCTGTGEAAATVAEALGAERFGIELNAVRAEAARAHLDHLLETSAFAVRLSNRAFSCLFLNPPYHHDDEKRRLEHAFLTSLTRALCSSGVLVYLIPQRRLAISARYLASHYAGFQAYRFPDPEYANFRQMVLFAVRKPQATLNPTAQAHLEAWSRDELPPLPEAPMDGSLISVPALPTGEVRFASLFFDPLQAAAEAQRQGVWVQPQFSEQLWPADEPPVRPLMPLRKGHLALLIAAGMLNNIVLRQNGHWVLVKGRTFKESVPVESGDEQSEIEREVLRTAITVLDLRTGSLEVIDQGSGLPAVVEPDAA